MLRLQLLRLRGESVVLLVVVIVETLHILEGVERGRSGLVLVIAAEIGPVVDPR